MLKKENKSLMLIIEEDNINNLSELKFSCLLCKKTDYILYITIKLKDYNNNITSNIFQKGIIKEISDEQRKKSEEYSKKITEISYNLGCKKISINLDKELSASKIIDIIKNDTSISLITVGQQLGDTIIKDISEDLWKEIFIPIFIIPPNMTEETINSLIINDMSNNITNNIDINDSSHNDTDNDSNLPD